MGKMFIGRVLETFELKGRGLVIATDTTYAQLERELKVLRKGAAIEIRSGEISLQTTIAGIELCDPWTPEQLFGFLLPREVRKADVPLGAELWTVEPNANPRREESRGA